MATRDASAGIAAGHVSVRPQEMSIRGVHPCEILVLQAALDRRTPRWFIES